MKYILTFLLCLSFAGFLQGQSRVDGTENQRNLDAVAEGGSQSLLRTYDNRYDGVAGTPYLYPDFLPGEVWLKTEEESKKMRIRYNIYLKELEFPIQGMRQAIPLSKITSFTIIDSAQVIHTYNVTRVPLIGGDSTELVVVEQIYAGRTTILRQPHKSFVKADYEGAYSVGTTSDEFRNKDRYYIRYEGEEQFQLLKMNRNAILKELSDQKSALRKFIFENELDVKRQSDMLKVIRYYDELTS